MLVQNAILLPVGDHEGCSANRLSTRTGSPPLAATDQITLSPSVEYGVITSPVQKMICRPSGDHAGLNPKSVTRRIDSPVAPTTKIPPAPPLRLNATNRPSGEKAGHVSSCAGSPAIRSGFLPPTRC